MQVSRTPSVELELCSVSPGVGEALKREIAGFVFGRIRRVYGDLRGAATLDLMGQDEFAVFVGSVSSRVLLVFRRYALFLSCSDSFCATVLSVCTSLLGRAASREFEVSISFK